MRRTLSFAAVLSFLAVIPACSPGQSRPTPNTTAPLQLVISGPGLIHAGQTLLFKATLINRSSLPIAISTRPSGRDESTFQWKIVDVHGKEIPRPPVNPNIFVCPVGGPLNDLAVIVLQPGEKFVYRDAGDPSDKYIFPGKGVYRVTMSYVMAPPSDFSYEKQLLPDERLSPENKVALKITPPVDITSNVQTMILE